jgi:hypothetical protein
MTIEPRHLNGEQRRKAYLKDRFRIRDWPRDAELKLGCDTYDLNIRSAGDAITRISISLGSTD